MVKATVAPSRDGAQVRALLDSPKIERLIADLDATRWTGRPGYPVRTMVGAALVKSVYCLPTWTRTVRLIAEHAALLEAIGGAPSVDACYGSRSSSGRTATRWLAALTGCSRRCGT